MRVPEKLGKYEIKKKIGRGNMGIVYRGHDPFSNQDVAIKIAIKDILPDAQSDKEKDHHETFFNEARIAGTLQHPNIIAILDAGIEDDFCYIVMELIENAKTLKHYCKANKLLPIKDIISIIYKCALALDYAHRNGVIHRDIKPSNILLTPTWDVKIGDFGIAKVHHEAELGSNIEGGFAGSPRYMSPEQIKGEINNQTDLFSLGITTYELLVGKHPFYAENLPEIIHNICKEKPQPITEYRQDLPDILDKIVRRTLHKNPQKRYKKGMDLAGDLHLAFDHVKKTYTDTMLKEEFNAIQKLEFFKDFPEDELLEIARVCSWQEHEPNIKVIIEGDLDDSFYVIVSGMVTIWKDSICIGTLKQGDCFGEMNYLSKNKRTASITTKEKTQLIKINSSSIEQASVDCQLRFSRQFIRTLIYRLSDTTSKYAAGQQETTS